MTPGCLPERIKLPSPRVQSYSDAKVDDQEEDFSRDETDDGDGRCVFWRCEHGRLTLQKKRMQREEGGESVRVHECVSEWVG